MDMFNQSAPAPYSPGAVALQNAFVNRVFGARIGMIDLLEKLVNFLCVWDNFKRLGHGVELCLSFTKYFAVFFKIAS